MTSLIGAHNLLIILDKGLLPDRDIVTIAKDLTEMEGFSIQLRDKLSSDREFFEEAKEIRRLTKGRIPFLINDRTDIALAVDADGVHLGQDDIPYEVARYMLGQDKIIGISTHSLSEAKEAQNMGADYIGVGPIFKTSTKPSLEPIGLDIVKVICEKIDIPAFFIGGINLENIYNITQRGGRFVAIASAILRDKNIIEAVKIYKDILRIKTPIQ